MRFFFCDAYCVISFRFENYFSFSHIWNVLAFEFGRYYGTATIRNAYTFRHEWKLHSCYSHISKFLAMKLVMCCGFSTLSIFFPWCIAICSVYLDSLSFERTFKKNFFFLFTFFMDLGFKRIKCHIPCNRHF